MLVVMCGRTRLSTDYSETRIKLKFDANYPAPNVPASWNVCPTDPMLVAVRNGDGKRISANAMGVGAVVGKGHQGRVLLDQCPGRGGRYDPPLSRRLQPQPPP